MVFRGPQGCRWPDGYTADYVGGNIRDAKLVDIWERSDELRFTREMTVDDLRGFCRTCYFAEECLSGCHWTSHVLLGQRGETPLCHHRALELLKTGERERIELVKPAPGTPFDYSVYRIVREPWPSLEEAERMRELNAWRSPR